MGNLIDRCIIDVNPLSVKKNRYQPTLTHYHIPIINVIRTDQRPQASSQAANVF